MLVAGEVVAGDEPGADEVGRGEVRPERVEGDGDHERGRVAAVQGEAGGVEGLEELDERLPHPLRVRQPGHRVTGRLSVPVTSNARVGVGLEVGREPGRGGVGEAGGDPGGAVAEAAHRQPGVLLGVGFEVGQAGGLGGLGDLGCDDVEDPASDPAELLRPELPGTVDEVRLGQRHRLGVHPSRQQAECAVDHPRLRQRRRTFAHRRRQHRPVPVERLGQAQVRPRVGVRRPGVLRQPARGILRRGVSGQVTGVGEDPQPQLRHLRLRGHQLPQRRRLVPGRHERRVGVTDGLQHRPDVAGGSEDRVRHPWPPRRRRTDRPRARAIESMVVAPGGPENRAITHPRNSPSEPGLSALVTESWWPGSVGERDSILRYDRFIRKHVR